MARGVFGEGEVNDVFRDERRREKVGRNIFF